MMRHPDIVPVSHFQIVSPMTSVDFACPDLTVIPSFYVQLAFLFFSSIVLLSELQCVRLLDDVVTVHIKYDARALCLTPTF
jgi:hypothetical protein